MKSDHLESNCILFIETFLKYVDRFPDWLVFDLGANIGQFSLFAAKMGRTVVTVEPFYDNLLRIHKAAKLANVEDKITLFKNGIGDEQNKILRLNPVDNNVGGQSLIHDRDKIFKEDPNDKYIVETVWFDDLINYLPKRENGQDFENAILKIDIEGFEPLAFTHASKLFDKLKFNYIYMEFYVEPFFKKLDPQLVVNMIDFLLSHELYPFTMDDQKLDKLNWEKWPVDVIFKRENI